MLGVVKTMVSALVVTLVVVSVMNLSFSQPPIAGHGRIEGITQTSKGTVLTIAGHNVIDPLEGNGIFAARTLAVSLKGIHTGVSVTYQRQHVQHLFGWGSQIALYSITVRR